MRHRAIPSVRPYDPLARSQYRIENRNFDFRMECGVDVDLRGGGGFDVVDIWTGAAQNVSTQSFTAKTVPHHGTVFFRVSKLSELS